MAAFYTVFLSGHLGSKTSTEFNSSPGVMGREGCVLAICTIMVVLVVKKKPTVRSGLLVSAPLNTFTGERYGFFSVC